MNLRKGTYYWLFVAIASGTTRATDQDWFESTIDVLDPAEFVPTRMGWGGQDETYALALDPSSPDSAYACITMDAYSNSAAGAISTWEVHNFGFLAYPSAGGAKTHQFTASYTAHNYYKQKYALVVRYDKNAEGYYNIAWQVPIGHYSSNGDVCRSIFVKGDFVYAYSQHDRDNYGPQPHKMYTYTVDGERTDQSPANPLSAELPITGLESGASPWHWSDKFHAQESAGSWGSGLNGFERPQITKFIKETGQVVWIENFKDIFETLYPSATFATNKDFSAIFAEMDDEGERMYVTYKTWQLDAAGTTWGSRYYPQTLIVDVSGIEYNQNPGRVGSSTWNVANHLPHGTDMPYPYVSNQLVKNECRDPGSDMICQIGMLYGNLNTQAPWNTATGTWGMGKNYIMCWDMSADKTTMMSAANGIDPTIIRALGDYINPEWDSQNWYNGIDCQFAQDGTSRILITAFSKMSDTVNPHLLTMIYDHSTDTVTQSAEAKYALAPVFDETLMEDVTYYGYQTSVCTGDGYCYRIARISNVAHAGYTNLYNAILVQIDLDTGAATQLWDLGGGTKMSSTENVKTIYYEPSLGKLALGGQVDTRPDKSDWSQPGAGSLPAAGAKMFLPTASLDYTQGVINGFNYNYNDAWVAVVDLGQTTSSPTATGYVPPPTTAAPTDAIDFDMTVFSSQCGTPDTSAEHHGLLLDKSANFFVMVGHKTGTDIWNAGTDKVKSVSATSISSSALDYVELHDATTGECLWIRPLGGTSNKYTDYRANNMASMQDADTIMVVGDHYGSNTEPASIPASADIASDSISPILHFINIDGSYEGSHVFDAPNTFPGLWTGKTSSSGPAPTYWNPMCTKYIPSTKTLWIAHEVHFHSTTTQTMIVGRQLLVSKHTVNDDRTISYVGHAISRAGHNIVIESSSDMGYTYPYTCEVDPDGNFFVAGSTSVDKFSWHAPEQDGNYGNKNAYLQPLITKYPYDMAGEAIEAWGRTWQGVNIDAQESSINAKETTTSIVFDAHDLTYEPVSGRLIVGVDGRSDDDEYQIYSLKATDGSDLMVHTSRMQMDTDLVALRAAATGGTEGYQGRGSSWQRGMLQATGTGSVMLIDELWKYEGSAVEFTPDYTQGGVITYNMYKSDARLQLVGGWAADIGAKEWVAIAKDGKFMLGTMPANSAAFVALPPVPTCGANEVLDQATNLCHSICAA